MRIYSDNIAPELRQKSNLLALVSLTLIPLTSIGIIASGLSPDGDKNTMGLMAICLLFFSISFVLNRKGKYDMAAVILIYACVLLPVVALYFKPHNSESVFETLIWTILPSLLGSVFFPVRKVIVLVIFTLTAPFLLLTVTSDLEFYSIFKAIVGIYFPLSVIIIIIAKVNETYIAKIIKQSTIISESLFEKESLLKEIHHRVKNNLQVITSLLSLQSSYIAEEDVKIIFRHSQNRINSMAMIHEMLYMNGNLSKINYKNYICELSHYLLNSFMNSDHKIKVAIDSPDVFLNIDTSIPLGLIINEIITNSLKYGFPDRKGAISIKIKQLNYPKFVLEIGDNGSGFVGDNNLKTAKTLGLKLIHSLSKQLKGKIEKDDSKKGTNYIISFQEIKQTS